MKEKILKFREKLIENNIDGFIINNPSNIEYLVNTKAEGFLVINKNENIFVTDGRYIEDVQNQITISDEINVQNISQLSEDDFFHYFESCERVGFEENYITYQKYRNMLIKFRIKEAIEAAKIIENLRETKEKDELQKIETACNITDACFLYLQDFIKIGMTEKEIAFEIEKFFITHNADGLAFDTIVASGVNSSKPHAIPTDKKIEFGDIILIDFGAKYKGYCADMTRTIFIGKVSEKQKIIYNFIKGVQERSINKMKSGENTKNIVEYVRNEFSSANFSLIHALGHGVGIDVHEKPYFSMKNNEILKANMIVTSEPGIYLPGEFGIRIEDTLLVNNMEPTILTKSNKNLLVI